MVFENITHRKFNGINVSEHHEFSHEKVFYYANLNSPEGNPGQELVNAEFLFSTLVELVPGTNKISVFSRNHYGFTSERRLRIFSRQ